MWDFRFLAGCSGGGVCGERSRAAALRSAQIRAISAWGKALSAGVNWFKLKNGHQQNLIHVHILPPLSSERQEKEGIQVTAKNKMNIKNVCMSWWDKRMLRKRSIIHYLKLSLINSNILFKSNIQDIEVSIIFLQIKWLIP